MARAATPPVMSVFIFPSSISRTIVRELVHQQTGRKTAACISVAGTRGWGPCVR